MGPPIVVGGDVAGEDANDNKDINAQDRAALCDGSGSLALAYGQSKRPVACCGVARASGVGTTRRTSPLDLGVTGISYSVARRRGIGRAGATRPWFRGSQDDSDALGVRIGPAEGFDAGTGSPIDRSEVDEKDLVGAVVEARM